MRSYYQKNTDKAWHFREAVSRSFFYFPKKLTEMSSASLRPLKKQLAHNEHASTQGL